MNLSQIEGVLTGEEFSWVFCRKGLIVLSQYRNEKSENFRGLRDFDFPAKTLAKGGGVDGIKGGTSEGPR